VYRFVENANQLKTLEGRASVASRATSALQIPSIWFAIWRERLYSRENRDSAGFHTRFVGVKALPLTKSVKQGSMPKLIV
jgi:hypothetical protein